jgi:carbon-monoxide dehydrogenase medium subunit
MKPPAFDYVAAHSLDEAIARLAEHGSAAKVLAGGQSLVPLLNMRLAGPAVLVDINDIEGLDGLAVWDGGVTIGALVRQSTLERANLIRQRMPLLVEAAGLVGHPAIRHRGTVGGSLAHADPAAELPAAMVALEAEVVVRSQRGARVLSAPELSIGYLTTALADDELLTEIRVPGVPPGTGSAFLEMARRAGDFAVCGTAALVTLNSSGRIDRVRIALCGVANGPIRARQVEQALVGESPSGPAVAMAAQRVLDEIDPPSDIHGSAAYRRKLAVVMARRAIELAGQRAGARHD